MSERVERVLVRVCIWLFFGVLLALLPVIMDLMAEVTRGSTAQWRLAVDRGELLLSTAALAALSTADHLVARPSMPRFGSTVLVCLNLSLVIFCTAWYAHVGSVIREAVPYEGATVATLSAHLFAGAVLVGLCSTVAVARLEAQDGR